MPAYPSPEASAKGQKSVQRDDSKKKQWRPLGRFAASVALSFCKLTPLANKNWRTR